VEIRVTSNGEPVGNFGEAVFEEKILAGEILPTDLFSAEGLTEWRPVSQYKKAQHAQRAKPPPLPATVTAAQRARTKTKKERTAAETGGVLAVGAAFAPLLHPSLFFLLSLPMLLGALVLAIVSITKGKVTGGIFLLIGLLPALMMSWTCMVDREKLLHHPEQLRESR
jgi:hypothetical protein